MKKIYFLFILFFLSACLSTPPIQNEVSRSQIYYAQTLADLYENFGPPRQKKTLVNGVTMYVFNQQEIVSDRVEKYFYDCKLRVFVQDDYVIDWDWKGNNCQFKEVGSDSELEEEYSDDDGGEWIY